MQYRRSISTRATFLARRFNGLFSYIAHDKDHSKQEEPSHSRIDRSVFQRRSYGSYFNTTRRFDYFFGQKRDIWLGTRLSFCRYMSTSLGEGSSKVDYINDVAGVITDAPLETIASQAQTVNEVAVAAADSAFPIAALQYLIDGVHSLTGLNWWASIALTTLLIRGITVPLLINQLKATSKLTLMRPRLEEIKEEMQATGMEPKAVAEGQQRMKELFKEYGVTPFTPLKGIFIQGPIFISFFLAISNMVEKVPSFKSGGAFWFTDLTTPDNLYIFPVLSALTFLAMVEFNMQEGLEGNPVAGTMKNVSRGLAVLTVPFTMSFPKAIFCYWVTSNLFSFAYGSVLKIPRVKKSLGVPEIPVTSPATKPKSEQSGFSLLQVLKQASATARSPPPVAAPIEQFKSSDRKPSSSAQNQRLRTLERQVKQRKKNKKM
ncbi:hypothetical protein Nepgr_024488 [Nepenthes gracilis]|uniref:Membrane insertase YidC/Oxa/ALB C-terminal domain-containing protein n=1 Tax=Nepenthes gracilis TaxID=150966 RepID=A0AAD3T4B5_NEPGR|nr:hypothetical protein Nepgr_024488 [Nepenthes gracilis]